LATPACLSCLSLSHHFSGLPHTGQHSQQPCWLKKEHKY
jgi:hypothetical protein